MWHLTRRSRSWLLVARALVRSHVPRDPASRVLLVSPRTGKTALMDYVRSKMYPKKDIRWLEANKAHWSFAIDITENLNLRLTEEPDTDPPSTFAFETADVCIMCFSTVDERTYQAIADKWNPAAGVNFDLRVLLVGTQVDLRHDGKKKAKPPASAPKMVVHEELKKASEHAKYCLSHMPSTVVLQIFSYLNLPDLYAAMRVSKRWQKIANGRYIWKNRVRRRGKAITPVQGESMRERIAAEKYIECSGETGVGMKVLVDEVLKQGLQALRENSTLGGSTNRRRRREDKKNADKVKGPMDEKAKARDNPKQANGAGDHKHAVNATLAATGVASSAGEEKKEEKKEKEKIAAPATNGTAPK